MEIEIVKVVPYQKCPKCDGQGIVSKPSWIAGDVNEWLSNETSYPCDVCHGAKIIPMCEIIGDKFSNPELLNPSLKEGQTK